MTELGLSNAAYALAIAAGPIGALRAGLLAAVLIRRVPLVPGLGVGMVAAAAFVGLAGAALVWGVLAFALFAAGAPDFRVPRRRTRARAAGPAARRPVDAEFRPRRVACRGC